MLLRADEYFDEDIMDSSQSRMSIKELEYKPEIDFGRNILDLGRTINVADLGFDDSYEISDDDNFLNIASKQENFIIPTIRSKQSIEDAT